MPGALGPAQRRALRKLAEQPIDFSGLDSPSPSPAPQEPQEQPDDSMPELVAPGAQPTPEASARALTPEEAAAGPTAPQPMLDLTQRPSPQPTPTKLPGFDWARALYAMGGGNVGDIDSVREARKRDAQNVELSAERKAKLQDLLKNSQANRDRLTAQQKFLLDSTRFKQDLAQKQFDLNKSDKEADNARADKALELKNKPRGGGTGTGVSKEDAKRIQLQMKSIDKKALEEMQNIDTADSMLKEAEPLLKDSYTGPMAGMAVKANDAIKAITGAVGLPSPVPDSIDRKLQNTQKLGANFEQAVADMRKGRFGSSFTEGEKAAFNEWAPGKTLSEEGNRNLMSAARKYFALRGQERMSQILQEVGVPFYLPPDQIMDLGDIRKMKALFGSMNFYDSTQTADTINELNNVLAKYGGRISGAPSKAVAAGVKPAAQAPTGGAKPDAAMIERAKKAAAAGNERAAKWLKENGV